MWRNQRNVDNSNRWYNSRSVIFFILQSRFNYNYGLKKDFQYRVCIWVSQALKKKKKKTRFGDESRNGVYFLYRERVATTPVSHQLQVPGLWPFPSKLGVRVGVPGCCRRYQKPHMHAYMLSCFASVVSNSLWPHGLQPTRLLCPWTAPRKNKWFS